MDTVQALGNAEAEYSAALQLTASEASALLGLSRQLPIPQGTDQNDPIYRATYNLDNTLREIISKAST